MKSLSAMCGFASRSGGARPDRDRRFASVAYEVPGAADLPIFLDRRAADAIERHALSDTSVELGGILLGKECLDTATGQAFVWVNQSLEAKHYANTQASFTYTHDSWEEITRERDQRFPQYDIVGWYHTHPNFGIFLSHHDLFIHHNFFSQALQVAYVVDPINQTRGFFQWRDGGMAQVQGYYLTADRGDRIALARLANDLEQLPNAEGGSGGAFSPRLEAELIKMLTRTGQRDVHSPVERLQFATVYGLLGIFLGVMGLATVLWLSQLLGQIQAMKESIQTRARVDEESAARVRLMSDALLERAVKDPVDFVALYEKKKKELDDVEKRAGSLSTSVVELGRDLKREQKDNERLVKELSVSNEKLVKAEEKAAGAAELNSRVVEVEKERDTQQQELAELKERIDPETGQVALAMKRKLDRTQYMMYGGWACSAFLGVAIAAAYFLLKPVPSVPLEDDKERPAHRIE